VTAVVAGAALVQLACVSQRSLPHPDLARIWRAFLALPEQRALAIAGDPQRDRWVSGASGGHESLEEAEENALVVCRQRRAQRRIQAACQIYAIGDEVVWAGPN
jgi:hypothetical protein